MKQAFFFGIVVYILLSCASKKKKQPENILPVQKAEKKISITSIGEIQFIRSYSEIQSMRDEKKIDEYLEKQRKSNPGYMKYSSDSILKPLFQNLGFVKGDELLLSKFKYSNKPDTSLKSFSGKEIKIHLGKDTISGVKDQIIIYYDGKSDSSETRPIFHQQVEYAFLDIIPGGNKELVVLVEDYLMNTEIYTFEVFEIKTTD